MAERENLTQRLVTLAYLTSMGSARASGSFVTAAVDAARYDRLVGVLHVGTLTSTATVQARFQHSSVSASSATGWADVSSASCISSAFTSGDNYEKGQLEFRVENYGSTITRYVRLKVDTTVSTWNGGAEILGLEGIYEPSSGQNAAAVSDTVVY
jgi:hypothetical protein